MTSRVVSTRADFARWRADVLAGSRLGVVLTMGALHDGHEALLRAARTQCDVVVATAFVNPAQFGPNEDLTRYPRTPDEDLARVSRAGADLLWTPSVAEVYPTPARVGIDPGPLGGELEGAARPGHFAGMLLVVHKFVSIIRPQVAFFGEKDYQQLTLIRAMCTDLDLEVDIVGVPTVREADGLAMSSRNAYLSPPQRERAVGLSQALYAGRDAASDGSAAVIAVASVALEAADIEADYLELRDPDLARAVDHGPARLLVAATVGRTRLIDNVGLTLGGGR